MKKLNIVKVLFAAASLALALPGCSDLGEESTAQTQVTKDGKVAVSLSVSENYRTIVSSVDTSGLAYKLVIADTDDSTTEGYEEPKIVEFSSLTGTKVYLTADKTYSFALTGYTKDTDGNATETAIVATRTAVTKKITASDATVSLTLQAVTTATVNVTLDVSYGTGYGVSAVSATVYDDSTLTTAATDTLTLDSENEKNSDKTDGEVEFSGTIATGSTKWVRIALSDGTKEIGGKTIALYGIPTGDLSGEVDAIIKEYKATVNLTADTKPASLTLKNKDFEDNVSYTGISLTTTSTDKPYVFTGYVPMGEYNVYNETTNIGQVSNTSALSVDTSVSLTSVAVAWKADDTTTDTQNDTLYAASSADDTTLESKLKNALVVTATMSNGTQTVSNYTITDFDPTKTDAQNVTISYTYNGVTKTAIISVKLTAVVLESIEVASTESVAETDIEGSARTPLKVTYDTNDTTLDLTGMVLKLTNNDGSTSLVEYNGSNITESGYYADNNGVAGDSIAEDTTIFANIGTYWVEVTYSGKSTMYKVTVKKGVTYVVEGVYNISTAAVTVDGTAYSAKYTTSNRDTYKKGGSIDGFINISSISNIDGNGFNVKSSDDGFYFYLNKTMFMTFADSNKQGIVITPSDNGTVDGGEKNIATGTLGNNGELTSVKLTKGTYTVKGATTSSAKIAYLKFDTFESRWESLKKAAGTADDYWSGWDAINNALSATPSTDDEYIGAISALQEAIDEATKYVKPTGITILNSDTIIAADSTVNFAYSSGTSLNLTGAFANNDATGKITWEKGTVTGDLATDIIEITPNEDGLSATISGLNAVGTVVITASDKDDRTGAVAISFTLNVIENEILVESSDSIPISIADIKGTAVTDVSKISTRTKLVLKATPAKGYSETVNYQWKKNGTKIIGETSATYTYTAVTTDVGNVVFTCDVSGATSKITATGTASTITVAIVDYTEDFAKYGTDVDEVDTVPGSISALAKAGTWYFASGATITAGTGDKSKIEAAATAIATSGFSKEYGYRLTLGNNVNNILSLPVDKNCIVTIYWLNNGKSARGLDIAATNGEFTDKPVSVVTKMTGNTTDLSLIPTISTNSKRIAVVATGSADTDKGYIKTTFNYSGETDILKIINTSKAATETLSAGGGGNYIYAIDVKYGNPPNTTIDVSSGIYSDITLIQDDSNANTFTVAGAPVTASGSEIAWLVDGDAVENESAATFTLTGKTTGEWYDVTVKVTTTGGVVYTKTTSVLYTGN